jgi:hypothetical protein
MIEQARVRNAWWMSVRRSQRVRSRELVEPADRPLAGPALFSEARALGGAAAGDDRGDLGGRWLAAVGIVVVGAGSRAHRPGERPDRSTGGRRLEQLSGRSFLRTIVPPTRPAQPTPVAV